MAKKKEEWQDPDSGYLNCICVGDTYVKKQIARILSQNKLTADYVSWFSHEDGIEAYTNHVEFNKKGIMKKRIVNINFRCEGLDFDAAIDCDNVLKETLQEEYLPEEISEYRTNIELHCFDRPWGRALHPLRG